MFERFTTNARAVVIQAQEEARQLQHKYIGTEHILLGLFATPTSISAQALRQLGVTATAVREAVEVEVGRGKETLAGHIPFTKRAKKILELALREALQLKHNYIGTEHILLAMEREGEGLAAKILASQLHDLGAIRSTVLELLGSGRQEHPAGEGPRRTSAADEVVTAAQALAGGAPMGSHHLLEALVRAEGSMAAKVLIDLGVDPAAIAAKVDEFDTEDTTDATPEETAARKMELRFVRRVASGGTGDQASGETSEDAGSETSTEASAEAGAETAASTGGEAGGKADEEVIEEVHLVFRDEPTIGLATEIARLVNDPITGTGPVMGKFVPLWTSTNELLMSLLASLREEPSQDSTERGKAALLVRRVLHDRLRRRGRAAD